MERNITKKAYENFRAMIAEMEANGFTVVTKNTVLNPFDYGVNFFASFEKKSPFDMALFSVKAWTDREVEEEITKFMAKYR